MSPPPARGWANLWLFAALQAGWWAAVLGAARGLPWVGPTVIAALLAGQLAASRQRSRDVLAVLGLGLVGTLADSLQSGLGLLVFPERPGAWLCPPWIAALWFHFGTALGGPLAGFASRPLLLAGLAAVAAPLAYAPGIRFGVFAFHPAVWPSVVSIATVWCLILPLAVRLANGSVLSAKAAPTFTTSPAGPMADPARGRSPRP